MLLGSVGLAIALQNRQSRCAAIPFLTSELLPNATLAPAEQPHATVCQRDGARREGLG